MYNIRIGSGFDVHKFVEGRDLMLGGVKIDYHLGLAGHSDADVLVHAIMDALLGASNLGDIGKLFPDSDSSYKNINSLLLLEKVYARLNEKNISIINIDSIVICEAPKILPYINSMKKNISKTLQLSSTDRISIKGTTTEHLGFTGRKEGIAVISNCLIALNS